MQAAWAAWAAWEMGELGWVFGDRVCGEAGREDAP